MRSILFLCSILLIAQLVCSAEVPRIGVLSDAGVRKEADQLLVELQKVKCDLVERDEIRKIIGEKELQGVFGREGCRRVGRLLKADGLVLLSGDTNKTIAVRLVAVGPGLIVWLAQSADGGKWAKTIAETIATYLPKLSVQADAAVPLTLLRVRPAFGMARAIRLANDCSQLLLMRLVREPRLFVLERENLARVEEESHWSGTETTFWTGSRLVEGTVSFDLVESNKVTLALTVRPPDGDKSYARQITVEGNANALPDLIEKVAAGIIESMGSRPEAAAWDRQAEGQRLLALAPHLEDPEQQKAAIGTAMALGCREGRTANDYRVALRAVAYRDARRFSGLNLNLAPGDGLQKQGEDFLELIRFHNEYSPPAGWNLNAKGKWLTGEEANWLFAYFPPLMDMKEFFDILVSTGRSTELIGTIREIQSECRRTAARMDAIDPHFLVFMQGHIVPATARYRHETTREILDVYRRLAFPPKTNAVYNAITCSTAPWFMDRKMAEPVLPGPGTEPPAERERLWQAFLAELQESDRPDFRISFALQRAQRSNLTPSELLDARRQLQVVIADCLPHFLAMPRNHGFSWLWNTAYPGVIKGLDIADLNADAQLAYETFLAVTPPNTLRPGEAESLIKPYLSLLTEDQARAVYRKTTEFVSPCAGIANCSYQGEVDVFAIQTWLGAQFPQVLDESYRVELARREGRTRIPTNALRVTESIIFPPYKGPNIVNIEFGKWRNGVLWVCWGNEWLKVDVARRTFSALPLPSELGNPAETAHFSRVMLTDDLLVYWKRLFSGPPDTMESHLAIHPVDGGEWRTARLPFEIRQLAQIGRKLYFTTAVPQIVVYQAEGVVEFDAETCASKTLRPPGTWAARRADNKAPIRFEHLTFGAGARDGLLLGTIGRSLYGWDPSTDEVRPLDAGQKAPPPSGVDTNSHEFGFDMCLSLAYGWIELKRMPAGHCELSVVPSGSREAVAVPILFPMMPEPLSARLRPWDWKSGSLPDVVPTYAISGKDGLCVPYASRRGLHFIPYGAIRQWLAANLPAPGKPVATAIPAVK